MRTTKRFTPKVLARFKRQGRGTGTHENYLPWHRVSRGDPASSGRSHLLMWRDRLRELLSDGEHVEQLFASQLNNVEDALEQFPLDLEDGPHLLTQYGEGQEWVHYPGIHALATQLNTKLPVVHDDGEQDDWIPSTDLVLTLRNPDGALSILALAFKPKGELDNQRKRQLLGLEREYWQCRGSTWLLITPELYDAKVADTLKRIAPWALGVTASTEAKNIAVQIARNFAGQSVTYTLNAIAKELGDHEQAQRALWQVVWHGELPVDLRRSWRPHYPFDFLSAQAFWEQNPIASRRSAWA